MLNNRIYSSIFEVCGVSIMIFLVSIGVAIILLAILIFALPLRLNLKGRGGILAASVIVGIIGIVAIQVLSLWQVILYPFLLSIIFSYFILKKLKLNPEPEVETHVVEDIAPAFSFAEQVEKAKLAETIDDYYDAVKIPNNGLSNDEILNSERSNTDIVDVDAPSTEMISQEMPDVETPSFERPDLELEEIIPLDVAANEKNDNSIKEIEEPIVAQIDRPSQMINSEMDLIDFEERDLHMEDESSNDYVESLIASSLETEEERLMESRRRLFQSMDDDSAKLAEKTDFSSVKERIDNRNLIEESERINNSARIEKLEDISEFTSLEENDVINEFSKTTGLEESNISVDIDDVEEINVRADIENLAEVSDVESLKKPEEISEWTIAEEELAELKRKRAAEYREKQQTYQDKVLAQFEDLEEIYLSKKGKIRDEEE